ncbi:dihydrofolate reductase-like isoform X2 [Styela clava]|uniref:dihydrofolate reductase-like isoform X2 n=1 Tax=Styela clava TaxID=7725 RepID=UPI001939F0DF|nr:dihydrofolate reductase-like isoform X2 [Styela clava]
MKIHSVVACDDNWGIAKNGTLPWKLPREYKHFNDFTSACSEKTKKNAVVTGRSNWKSRAPDGSTLPLANRHNFILSTSMKTTPEGSDGVAGSLKEFIDLVESDEWSQKIHRVFNIGGSQIYKCIQDSDYCGRCYVTKIKANFDCDLFICNLDEDENFRRVERSEEWEKIIPVGIQYENGFEWEVLIYEKIQKSRQ